MSVSTYQSGAQAELADKIRFFIGDTDASCFLLSDDDLRLLISVYPNLSNPIMLASKAALALAAQFSRQVDRSLGDARVSSSQRAQAFRTLSRDLEVQAKEPSSMTLNTISIGGNASSCKEIVFSIGMDENPDRVNNTPRGR